MVYNPFCACSESRRQYISSSNGEVGRGSNSSKKNLDVLQRKKRPRRQTRRGFGLEMADAATDGNAAYKIPNHPKFDEQKKFLERSLVNNFISNLLNKGELDQLIMAMESETFKAGSKIIRQHEFGDYFYLIGKGTVGFEVNDDKVGCAMKCDSFGETALLFDCPRTATAVAATNVLLWRLDQRTFRHMLANNAKSEMENIMNILGTVPFLANLSQNEMGRIVDALMIREFMEDERIVEKGEEGDLFYILKEGTVKVTDIGHGESSFTDITLQPGAFFGERALITSEPRAANITAVTDCSTLCLTRDDFTGLFGDFTELLKSVTRRNILSGAPMFAGRQLNRSKISKLISLMDTQYFERGVIFSTRGESQGFYIIEEGQVQLTNGEGVVSFLNKDDYFGGIKENEVVTVKILLSTVCSVLSKENIELAFKSVTKPTLLSNVGYEDFQVHGIIGDGTYGLINIASIGSNYYILKEFFKRDLISDGKVEDVFREKDILCSMQHPFIVRIFAAFPTDYNLYIATEYIPGGELTDVIYDTAYPGLSMEAALFYSACVLETLMYMHSRNVCYRDLKPENILLDKKGYGILFDFGVAKIVLDKTYTLCGTPQFIAPEVVMLKGYDSSADYWSFGVFVFELLAGYTPFFSKNVDDVTLFKRILKAHFTFPKRYTFTEDTQDFLRKLIEKKVSHRLGCLAHGAEDIKNHPFFDEVDWDGLYNKTVPAPFIPTCNVNAIIQEISKKRKGTRFPEEVTKKEDLQFLHF